MIWELLVFGQILAHEGPPYPNFDKAFPSKIQFEYINLEDKMLKKTFSEPIFGLKPPRRKRRGWVRSTLLLLKAFRHTGLLVFCSTLLSIAVFANLNYAIIRNTARVLAKSRKR